MVSLSGGEPKRIDDGVWPAVSARGDLVAYIKRGQIWAAPLVRTSGGIAPGDPQQLIHDRGVAAPQGNATSLRWSPTGHRLMFVSFREEHSFIGVYDADRRTLLFLDPSFDRDQEPIWSMDGRRVAFIRVPSAPGERPSETRSATMVDPDRRRGNGERP